MNSNLVFNRSGRLHVLRVVKGLSNIISAECSVNLVVQRPPLFLYTSSKFSGEELGDGHCSFSSSLKKQ